MVVSSAMGEAALLKLFQRVAIVTTGLTIGGMIVAVAPVLLERCLMRNIRSRRRVLAEWRELYLRIEHFFTFKGTGGGLAPHF